MKPVSVALLGLSVLGAACLPDITQDFTETFLFTDPVERFEIVVDRGSLVATVYDLEVVKLKRHTFGFPSHLGTPDDTLEDGVYRFEAHCGGRVDECTWDHMLELPPGREFDVTMTEGYFVLGDLDGDFTAKFVTGEFHATEMRSANLDITADSAVVDVEFVEVPASVTVAVGDGEVTLKVPADSYRCEFAGDLEVSGISCDDAAEAVLDLDAGAGTLVVTGVAP